MAKAAKKKALKEDKRIDAVALLIQKKYIKTWADIFKYIPRSTVAEHLHKNNDRMKFLVDDPSTMTIAMLNEVAVFLKVKPIVIAELALKALPVKKKKKD